MSLGILQTYRLLSRNRRLAVRRHPLFGRTLLVKAFILLGVGLLAVYLFVLGWFTGFSFRGYSNDMIDLIGSVFPLILMVDFFLRFAAQETPSQELKPYKLLPVKTKTVIGVFLVGRGLSVYNLFSLFFFVPFGFATIAEAPMYGALPYVSFLLGVWLLFVLNSYWYLICRTLINRNVLYVIVPVVVWGVVASAVLTDTTLSLSRQFIHGFVDLSPLSFITVALLIVALFVVNVYVQRASLYEELGRTAKASGWRRVYVPHVLDGHGITCEFLKLEALSLVRNAAVRKRIVNVLFFTVVFAVLAAFSSVYGGKFMHVFILYYCFCSIGMTYFGLYGVVGNYIDLLMNCKESVLKMLYAKYYFAALLLVAPLLMMCVSVITGGYTVTELLCCLLYTLGCVFPCLLCQVIFCASSVSMTNQISQRVNQSLTEQVMNICMVALPIAVAILFLLVLDEVVASVALSIFGLVGILLHRLWIKWIYKQFMKRRYENMSGFRATR